MKKILIIGGGAMGSAFSVPCLENNNKVTITEPYNKIFIKNLSSKQKFHSSLKLNLPKKLQYRKYSKDILKEKFDLVYDDVLEFGNTRDKHREFIDNFKDQWYARCMQWRCLYKNTIMEKPYIDYEVNNTKYRQIIEKL